MSFTDAQGTVPLQSVLAFAQGINPVLWTYSIWQMVATAFFIAKTQGLEQSPLGALLLVILIAVLSLAAFHLFSGRKRLERNLPSGVTPPGEGAVPRKNLIVSTAMLVAFGAGFAAGGWFWGFHVTAAWFPTLAMLVAGGFDLASEFRFRQRHGNAVCLLVMDNVYCASYLQSLLARHGLHSSIRAFHFRSLLFDLGPIYKMELLIPTPNLEQAREIVGPERMEVV